MSGKEKKLTAETNLSGVKNKQLRSELYTKQKKLKSQEKIERRKKAKQNGAEKGEKPAQKTLENMRVKDETIVESGDEEVLLDEETDEFASYFNCDFVPKVLITTCNRPKSHETIRFIGDILKVIPNSVYKGRKGVDLKKVIPMAVERGFTALVVVNEDQKRANGLVISHLPDGPTAHFKLTSVKHCRRIKNHGRASHHRPEILLNNFSTRLGHRVARVFASLFPYDPQFQGRRAVTFHNQRDFIFFRQHRYIFKDAKKTGLQEIGPRFTLKLRSLQKGAFDSLYGEYEWIHKRKEMDTSRRKFHL